MECHTKIIHSNKEIMISRTQCQVCRHTNVVKLYIPVCGIDWEATVPDLLSSVLHLKKNCVLNSGTAILNVCQLERIHVDLA